MTISGIGICQRHSSFARVLARLISIHKREAAPDHFLKNQARKSAGSIEIALCRVLTTANLDHVCDDEVSAEVDEDSIAVISDGDVDGCVDFGR